MRTLAAVFCVLIAVVLGAVRTDANENQVLGMWELQEKCIANTRMAKRHSCSASARMGLLPNTPQGRMHAILGRDEVSMAAEGVNDGERRMTSYGGPYTL